MCFRLCLMLVRIRIKIDQSQWNVDNKKIKEQKKERKFKVTP